MRWIKERVCKWLGVDALRDRLEAESLSLRVATEHFKNKTEELDALTTIDIDAHYRGDCTIVLTGHYRGRAYVKFYDVPHDAFKRYVDEMRYYRKKNVFRNVDAVDGFAGHFGL